MQMKRRRSIRQVTSNTIIAPKADPEKSALRASRQLPWGLPSATSLKSQKSPGAQIPWQLKSFSRMLRI